MSRPYSICALEVYAYMDFCFQFGDSVYDMAAREIVYRVFAAESLSR